MSPQEGISLNFNKHVLLPRGFGRSSRNLHEEIFRTWALTQGFIFSLGTLLFVCLGTWYTKGVVTCSTFHTARRRNMTGMQPMEGNKWRKIHYTQTACFQVLSPIFCEQGWTLVVSHVGKCQNPTSKTQSARVEQCQKPKNAYYAFPLLHLVN